MLKTILLFALLFSSLFSNQKEEFSFMGLNVSSKTIDLNSNNENITSIGLRYGKQTLDWRTIFNYDYSEEYQSFSIEIDKILMDKLFGTPKLRPYIGAAVGTLKLNYDSLADDSGYYYGPSVGFIIYATDNIDIDLAYHYYTVQEIESVDEIQGITLSVHYFY